MLQRERPDLGPVREEKCHRRAPSAVRRSSYRRRSASTPKSCATYGLAGARSSSSGLRILHELAFAQHGDAIGHVQRFLDVVRDEQNRGAQRADDAQHFVLQRSARDGIDRAERFVHQQHARLGGDGARDADALLLAAGELARKASAIAPRIQTDQFQKLVDAPRDAIAIPVQQFRNDSDVLRDGHVSE